MRCMKLLFLLAMTLLMTATVRALSTHELMARHTRIVGACMRGDLGLSLPNERLATCAIASALELLRDSPKQRCASHAIARARAISPNAQVCNDPRADFDADEGERTQ